MQTLFFGLAALITPTNINWLMAVQFLAMFPFGTCVSDAKAMC